MPIIDAIKYNADVILNRHHDECLRAMETATTVEAKKAWYYTHLGEMEIVRNMGLITEEQRYQRYCEWREHCPALEVTA